ncbi:hypothetical protein JMJ35_010709 [Cladonia borealis]|uniref:Major facilitator superfamily (MFS) profile domain-containing protein n=1 Tax=Cladonia borealis TaxID=184061 RepID=A0AA39QRQ1_9LECA|nr:hypothetical protein JMJ35_010709 [Cladonia borealis]
MTGPEDAEKGIDSQQRNNAAAMSHGAVQKPLRGWRLMGVLSSLALGLLLATIETSITATALVTIGEYFGNSVTVTWVVLAYLLSYMGFAIIFTRLSDGIGRQPAVIIAYVFFAAFSLGAGLAQTLGQLIALRFLQGIGGAGLYSMLMVITVEISPVEYWGALSGMIGLMLAIGSVLGPILGGVITERASWRWIYLFNAPAAAVGIAVMLFCWPRKEKSYKKPSITWQSIQQVDWVGAILLLAASILLVFALQEGGSIAYSWSSATIISTLTISGVCWIAFFAWVSWLSFRTDIQLRAIFPFTIALTGPVGPAIILILLNGFPYFVAIINLPLRFQVVNGDSPIMAGVHLLPLLNSMAFGSFVGGAASSKKNNTFPTLIIAACLVLLGCGLLSTLGGGREFYKPTYGYQVILGLGVGLTFSSVTALTNINSKSKDIAAAQGAVSQARALGGTIGLSMATIVLNNKLSTGLAGVLDPVLIKSLEQSLNNISTLNPNDQALVAQAYTDAFNSQMRICTYLSAVALLAAIATYQKNPASVARLKQKQRAMAAEDLSDEGKELGSTVGATPVQAKSYEL